MKTKEEIEQLASKRFIIKQFIGEDNYNRSETIAARYGFEEGYTQCQEDMKPLLNDLFSLWQHLARIGEISIGKNFTKKYEEVKKSLNKQD
jgi:hypothetical protein